MNFVPHTLASPEKISILLVSPHSDDLASLRNILHHGDWVIVHCRSVADAAVHLRSAEFSVVVAENVLPDGCWKDVLRTAESQSQAPLVLVVSRHADDRLWAEVLNLGGYDLLLKPFDRSEVTRVVGMAWRCWFGAVRRAVLSAKKTSPAFA
jgi:DNA-binding NtrC family response regulator